MEHDADARRFLPCSHSVRLFHPNGMYPTKYQKDLFQYGLYHLLTDRQTPMQMKYAALHWNQTGKYEPSDAHRSRLSNNRTHNRLRIPTQLILFLRPRLPGNPVVKPYSHSALPSGYTCA